MRGDQTRVNERIRAPRVRVIDGTTNQQLGVMHPADAVRKAKSMGLDLVEVAANASPPVCRICDYGKWKYEQAKQKKHQVNKGGKLKEVKFRVGIDPHDYNIKMARGERFLGDGHKVRIQIMFKGRQMAHPELGIELANEIIADFKTMGHPDAPPRKAGRNISMLITPWPKEQRKPKFTSFDDLSDEDDEEHDHDHEEESGGDEGAEPKSGESADTAGGPSVGGE